MNKNITARAPAAALFQRLVVEHAVAIALKAGVFDLLLELLAHTFGGFRALQTARAVATGFFEPFFYGFYNFLVWV